MTTLRRMCLGAFRANIQIVQQTILEGIDDNNSRKIGGGRQTVKHTEVSKGKKKELLEFGRESASRQSIGFISVHSADQISVSDNSGGKVWKSTIHCCICDIMLIHFVFYLQIEKEQRSTPSTGRIRRSPPLMIALTGFQCLNVQNVLFTFSDYGLDCLRCGCFLSLGGLDIFHFRLLFLHFHEVTTISLLHSYRIPPSFSSHFAFTVPSALATSLPNTPNT